MVSIHIVLGLLAILFHSTEPGVSASPAASPESDASTRTKEWQTWGPYRPGHYFGVRPNIPKTLLMGLMWGNGTTKDSLKSTLRDTTTQDDDGVESFGWTLYDPRVGGSQTIRDKALGVDLTTEFVKNEDGSGWAVRVSGAVRPDVIGDTAVKTSLIFHVAMEGTVGSATKSLVCERLSGGNGHIEGAECRGKDPALGEFSIRVNADPKDCVITGSSVKSRTVAEDTIWQAKTTFTLNRNINNFVTDSPGAGNMHFIRFDFAGPFSATFSYRDEGGVHISPDAVAGRLEDLIPSYSTQLDVVFPRASPFREPGHAAFSQALLSNLLGGLGFFHGDSMTSEMPEDSSGVDVAALVAAGHAMVDSKITTTEPSSLFTFTPSRSSFPRGFLWDEGFHLLAVIEWDLDLAITVMLSWLDQMDQDGWIAREQILGPEARSRVPKEFQIQHPHHANPPTFLALVLPALLSKLTFQIPYRGHESVYLNSPTKRKALLKDLYKPLTTYYAHFRRTQAGNLTTALPRPSNALQTEGYRWRGRTLAQHTLTSGLDDYPRAEPPSPIELHADALAWVSASAKALAALAQYLRLKDDVALYETHLADGLHNLDALHWDDREGAYCDSTVTPAGEYAHICHVGYVSLMPLLLGLMNASHPHLPALLATLADPMKLWSEHGLRSLSAKDEYYGTEEDYWRGAVWMHLNVLAVLRLKDISGEEAGEVSRMAGRLGEALRERAVRTVYGSWVRTGTVWEQYGDVEGEGRRGRGFTGWTATVLLVMGLSFGQENVAEEGGNAELQVDQHSGHDEAVSVMQTAARVTSTRTLVTWVLVMLVGLMLRRRIVRFTSRFTGAWERRRPIHGARHREVIALDDRTK